MNTKLNDISQIQSGVYAKQSKNGDVLYLQSGHINESGGVEKNVQPTVVLDHKLSNFILKEGDILFSAKGNRNISVVYDAQWGRAVASSTFFVIRLAVKSVIPEYLSWFLNHPKTQLLLKAQAKGVNPPSISIETMKDLQIEIPDIRTQQEILDIYALRKRERELIHQIEELKEQELQHRLYHSSMR
ncbi:MAG: restriction endonuclease subunit S [Bacteroidota bacterium]